MRLGTATQLHSHQPPQRLTSATAISCKSANETALSALLCFSSSLSGADHQPAVARTRRIARLQFHDHLPCLKHGNRIVVSEARSQLPHEHGIDLGSNNRAVIKLFPNFACTRALSEACEGRTFAITTQLGIVFFSASSKPQVPCTESLRDTRVRNLAATALPTAPPRNSSPNAPKQLRFGAACRRWCTANRSCCRLCTHPTYFPGNAQRTRCIALASSCRPRAFAPS